MAMILSQVEPETDRVDRAGLCRYCCCWIELGANPDRVLGYRDQGRRAIP